MTTPLQPLTLYYDGQCPLCLAEIRFLSRRPHGGLLAFVDVTTDTAQTVADGISCAAALANMHGRLADGTLLVGVSVFPAAYQRAGLPAMAWVFSRPWLQPFWRAAYAVFARYRHGISRVVGPPLLRWVSRR